MEYRTASVTGDHTEVGDVDVERQLDWKSGSVLMKAQAPESGYQRNFIRVDLAIGIVFQNPGSEVTWQLDGELVLAKAWPPTPGSHDLVILPPGCQFHAHSRGSAEHLWLFLDPRSVADDDRTRSFLRRAAVNNSWARDKLAWMIASQIRKECENDFPRGSTFLESAAMLFVTQLAYILDGTVPPCERVRTLDDTKLKEVVDYINFNLHRNITLSELSDLVHLTPKYFCSAFKKATHRPPHQYIIEQRIERARTLLCDPNMSLSNIALTVGFSSQSHFNMHFRRTVGVPPGRYRIEMREQVIMRHRRSGGPRRRNDYP